MKINNIILILVLTITVFSAEELESKCRRDAKVKYMTEYGWSKLYDVEVIFMTGYELNTATNTFNYNAYAVYGVIFWAQNQATVIKLSTILLCGSEVTCDCVENSLVNLTGYDQDGDKWSICLGRLCL